jgi:2-C-methyl-D-erythritol 4-phosphate cytidylyltransferase
MFIAVLGRPAPVFAAELEAAGAHAVLSWPDLAAGLTDDAWDEVPAVLVDVPAKEDSAALIVAVAVALATLAEVDGALAPTRDSVSAVIATTRPVTDTLKFVAADGALTGTADRDEHRYVATPIAAKLCLLRSVSADLPADEVSPVAVLAALVERGTTVVAT